MGRVGKLKTPKPVGAVAERRWRRDVEARARGGRGVEPKKEQHQQHHQQRARLTHAERRARAEERELGRGLGTMRELRDAAENAETWDAASAQRERRASKAPAAREALLADIRTFRRVLKHASFKEDALGAIRGHVRESLKRAEDAGDGERAEGARGGAAPAKRARHGSVEAGAGANAAEEDAAIEELVDVAKRVRRG